MSIKSQMQNKAVAMAEAAAARARTPQELGAIRQQLVSQVQSGTVPPYVGIPLIQDLTQKMAQAQAKMAQQVAGMGVPQAPQGAPIAQQVMAQAQQPSGVEALPSNLPASYAPGGLVAFEEGGPVERYQTGGTPVGRWWEGVKSSFGEANEEAKLRNELQMKYGPASALPGLFMTQTDEQRQQAKQIAQLLPSLSLPQLKILKEQGAAAIPNLLPPTDASAAVPTAGNTPAAPAPTAEKPPVAPPTKAPAAAPGVAMPNLTLPKVTLPTMPAATDFASITKDLPENAKTAFETARNAEERYLRELTEPGEQAREKRFTAREAAIEKDSAMGRALNLMSLGFGIAGSKERTLAGALGNEGRQGIQALIQGEAANRVAKERLEDARDNFEQQKIASKKGDRAAASAAGQRAADDLRAYAGLNLQAAQAGSGEAMQRYSAQQSGVLGVAQLEQSGVLGLAQLRQQAGIANAQLQLGREKLNILKDQIAAGNKRAQAALETVQQKAYAAFQNDPQTRMLLTDLQKKYGNLQHPEAQRQIAQARQTYLMNALSGMDTGGTSVKDVADLLKD